VPDLWNEELNTSSVFVAERIDPLPAPLTPQQQAERPYALGTMEIVPAVDTKFAKSDELQTFLLIYNARTDKENKPDISVEFNFHTTVGGAEKFFNKTNPQNLNAQTLPPGFDFAAGHQLQAGQAVPLTSFPEGEYRLEIKVTDKLAGKDVTRNVNFTVGAQ
jgi:FAD synthase